MAKRFTAQRRDQLVQLVLDEGSVSITQAAERFGVSGETIRKDIIELDAQDLVLKTRGGAMRVSEVAEKPMFEKTVTNAGKKMAIAAKAFEFIPTGSSVIIDAGSTPLALARLIAKESGYTVFTNSAPVIEVLAASDNQLFVLGGHLRKSSGALIGDWTNSQLEAIQAGFAVVGADACAPEGPTINPYEEVAVKRGIFSAAKTSMLLADSSKFTKTAAFQFCAWDAIDMLITDSDVSEKVLSQYGSFVHVEVAPAAKVAPTGAAPAGT